MIYRGTRLKVADNSGALEVECIHVLGGSYVKCATIGERIVVAVKKALPDGKVKKGEVSHAVVVRVRKSRRREDGSYVTFDDNAAVLLNKQNETIGTRVFGPVGRDELKGKYPKILSLAPEAI